MLAGIPTEEDQFDEVIVAGLEQLDGPTGQAVAVLLQKPPAFVLHFPGIVLYRERSRYRALGLDKEWQLAEGLVEF